MKLLKGIPAVSWVCILIFVSMAAVGQVQQSAEDRWLKAAIHMLVDSHDPFVSTTDINRVAAFVQWGVTNGYSVKIANRDWVTGIEREGMYFLTVDKMPPVK